MRVVREITRLSDDIDKVTLKRESDGVLLYQLMIQHGYSFYIEMPWYAGGEWEYVDIP